MFHEAAIKVAQTTKVPVNLRKLRVVLVGGFSEGNSHAEKSRDGKHFHMKLFGDDPILFKLCNIAEGAIVGISSFCLVLFCFFFSFFAEDYTRLLF